MSALIKDQSKEEKFCKSLLRYDTLFCLVHRRKHQPMTAMKVCKHVNEIK